MKTTILTQLLFVAALALILAACGASAAPPAVVETVVVEKVVEKEVQGEVVEVVVTATPEPVADRSDEPVDLRFTVWSGNEDHLNMLNGFVAAFQEAQPNVTIQFDTIPFTDYIPKVTLQLAGSNPPDGGWLLETSAPTFVQSGVLADLKPFLADPAYDYADFSESALELWVADDAVYGVPFSTSPFLILYNRDMFEAAGLQTPNELAAEGKWTWDAFAAAAKAIAEDTPAGVYGYDTLDAQGYEVRTLHNLIPIIRAYGGDAWDVAGTTCLLNSPESVAAVQRYHDMIFVDHSVVPPGEQADFYSGSAGMTIGQLSRVAKLKDAAFNWDVAPLPAGSAGEVAVIGQAALVAFETSPHKDVAAEFIAFMTNKENVATMAQFFPPARISILESGAMLDANPLVDPASMEQAVVSANKAGAVLPFHVEFPNIDPAARAEFDNLWSPEADVEAVLNAVCEAISPFMNQ